MKHVAVTTRTDRGVDRELPRRRARHLPSAPPPCAPDCRSSHPASAWSEHPYPGLRPAGSFVVDADGGVRHVRRDAEGVHRVAAEGDPTLEEWLAQRGAAPLDRRRAVLSYGSNACPAKLAGPRLAATLPVVALACTVDDLATAWCAGVRHAGDAVPATLVAAPGRRESHVVVLVDEDGLAALDVVEGCVVDEPRYDLVELATGRVVLDDGTEPAGLLAYVGVGTERRPLCTRAGEPWLVAEHGQAEAVAAVLDGDDDAVPGEPPALGPSLARSADAPRSGRRTNVRG